MNVSNFTAASLPSVGTYQHTSYRLQITNLYTSTLEFALETRVPRHPAGERAGQLQLFWGDQTNAWGLASTNWVNKGASFVDTQVFSLEPEMSVAFNIAIGPPSGELNQAVSVLGHIRLRVPVTRASGRFLVNAQTADPVPVLLSASQIDSRGPYRNYARDLDGVTKLQLGGSDWYSTEAIPLASGKAENLIQPDGFQFKDVIGAVSKLRDFQSRDRDFQGALGIAEAERVPALVDLLTNLSGDRAQLKAVNELLHELGSQVEIRQNG